MGWPQCPAHSPGRSTGLCLQPSLARAPLFCRLHQRSPQPTTGVRMQGWAGHSLVPPPKNQHPEKPGGTLRKRVPEPETEQRNSFTKASTELWSETRSDKISPLHPQRQTTSPRCIPRCRRDFWWLPACSQLHTVAGKVIFFLLPPRPARPALRSLCLSPPVPPSASNVTPGARPEGVQAGQGGQLAPSCLRSL